MIINNTIPKYDTISILVLSILIALHKQGNDTNVKQDNNKQDDKKSVSDKLAWTDNEFTKQVTISCDYEGGTLVISILLVKRK